MRAAGSRNHCRRAQFGAIRCWLSQGIVQKTVIVLQQSKSYLPIWRGRRSLQWTRTGNSQLSRCVERLKALRARAPRRTRQAAAATPNSSPATTANTAGSSGLVAYKLDRISCTATIGSLTAWHGPSVAQLLDGLSASDAAFRPADDAHNIWELVLHIAQWDVICARRLQGEDIRITTGDPEDWPPLPAVLSDESWNATLQQLKAAQEDLLNTVGATEDAQISQTVPHYGWTKYLMIHGTLHHDLYHAGQIGLLRRLAADNRYSP